MIQKLGMENFTVFGGQHSVRFAPGLNIIIGENGSGKSHLLKLAYTLTSASHLAAAKKEATDAFADILAERFMAVFSPDALGHLVHRRKSGSRCRLTAGFADTSLDFGCTFTSLCRDRLEVTEKPEAFLPSSVLYLPTAEIFSLYGAFHALLRHRTLPLEAAYADLMAALERAPAKEIGHEMEVLLERIEGMMGGRVEAEKGRFYIVTSHGERTEMSLAGEGAGKIATVAWLIGNGTLRPGTLLFWDEPETNLNPRYIRKAVDILMHLARLGVQVFLTSHSLFLLREIEILSGRRSLAGISQRYIALGYDKKGRLLFEQADSIEEVEPVVTLEEALSQADRYLELG
ncbi:ATP-binding protein [Hydrogenimonas sp. SS33]|uniref:AAA family ATPase n=1 Tax=Hydrogenimonas leucolamina TaxID=2954236 RepID=UPI00336BC806